MAFFTKSGGIWRTIQNLWVKQSGSWRQVQSGWVKQGGVWRQFYSSVTLPTTLQYFMVGGGGRGLSFGGGGGANVRPWTSTTFRTGTINVVVGRGGSAATGTNGGASSISGLVSDTCTGGNGSTSYPGANSGNGRSGGGPAGWTFAPAGGGGAGFAGNGGGASNSGIAQYGGCPNYQARIYAGRGGDGYSLPLDLRSRLGTTHVAGGGGGNSQGGRTCSGRCYYNFRWYTACYNVWGQYAYDGAGGAGSTSYGGGGQGSGGAGRDGVVVFKYSGTPTATGGSISYDSASNTTYHVFTTNGSLVLP